MVLEGVSSCKAECSYWKFPLSPKKRTGVGSPRPGKIKSFGSLSPITGRKMQKWISCCHRINSPAGIGMRIVGHMRKDAVTGNIQLNESPTYWHWFIKDLLFPHKTYKAIVVFSTNALMDLNELLGLLKSSQSNSIHSKSHSIPNLMFLNLSKTDSECLFYAETILK